MKKLILFFLAIAAVFTLASCFAIGSSEKESGDAPIVPPTDEECVESTHIWTENGGEEPTCDTDGYADYYCSKCYATMQETLPKLEHEYVLDKEESTKADCDDYGYDYYTCKHCDSTYYEQLDILAHNFAIETYVDPSCYGCGYIQKVCTKCKERYEEYLTPPYEHVNRTQASQEPTCTEDGWEEYTYCLKCDENDKHLHIKPALSHDMSTEWTVDVEPTETTVGSRSHHCQREGCDYTEKSSEIPRLGYSDFLKYKDNGTYYTVTGIEDGHQNDIAVLSIPEEYNGKPVKYISASAFAGNTKIAMVKIPSTIVNIGRSAFASCTNLVTVEMATEGNMQLIDVEAFAYCYSLTRVNFSNKLLQIDDYAFKNCALNSVVIPDSVAMVCYGAFYGCNSLTSITMPHIYDEANDMYEDTDFVGFIFGATTQSQCASYIPASLEEIVLTKVTEITSMTFAGCSGVKRIYLSDAVTEIAPDAFNACTSLVYNVHDGVNYIGSKTNPYVVLVGAVDKTKTAYDIKDAVFMMEHAFENCTALTSVTLPSTLTKLPSYAFAGCTALEALPSLAAIKSIGLSAFDGCTKMSGEANFSTVTTIGKYAFRNCNALSSVKIGESVKSIGEGAFHSAGSGSASFRISFDVATGWRKANGNAIESTFVGNSYNVTQVLTNDGSNTSYSAAFSMYRG